MDEFKFVAGFVQTAMTGEILEGQQRTNGLEFGVRQREKNNITDRPALEVGAFAPQ